MRRLAMFAALIAGACGGEQSKQSKPSSVLPAVVAVAEVSADAGVVTGVARPAEPAFQPPPGTAALAVIDAKGNVTTRDDAANLALAQLVATCHTAGRPSGHVVIAIEEDPMGRALAGDVVEHAGVDEKTIACVRDAIGRSKGLVTLGGILQGFGLPDGGWKPGSGLCYVTLY